MSTYLYRLGRFSFRRRRLVGLLWLGLLIAAVAGAVTLSGETSEEFRVPGTESQQANDVLKERFPEAGTGGATARVVFAAPPGEKLQESGTQSAIDKTIDELRDAPEVAKVEYSPEAVSKDGRITFAEVSYKVPAGDITDGDREALRDALDPARDAGLTVETGGDAIKASATGAAELIGVVVAAVALLVALGSVVAAGLPLLLAFVGLGISVCAVYAATGFFDLTEDTVVLAVMIGLALAIDYSLFVIFRYRQEARAGRSLEEAAGRAVGTAGTAVVFAGLTVLIALLGLSVVQLPPLTQIAVAAALAVAVTVCVALTLLPAVLGFVGPRAVRGRRAVARPVGDTPGKGVEKSPNEGTLLKLDPPLGQRFCRLITRHPIPTLVATLAALAVVALPVQDMRLGLPDEGTDPTHTTQRKAYDLLSEGFGPGFNGPLLVAVESAEGESAKEASQRTYDQVKGLDGVAAVNPAVMNEAGDTGLLTVVPTGGPTSESTNDLVDAIRDKKSQIHEATGAQVAVTGQTALNIDMSKKLSDALLPYLILVVGLAFLLLMIVFRSLLVPLTAALGFLLSVGATFGAVVAVFQWGWLTDVLGVDRLGVIVNLLPIFLIGVVFGLAMDYQVFLVTRMREAYVHGASPKDAVVVGFAQSARVVTAAAVIMMSVFGGFVLADSTMIQAVGYALAAAVFFDAFVMRMTVVPAVMSLLGRAGWWLPAVLEKVLPDVDVEGERLRRFDEPPKDEAVAAPREPLPEARRE
ncbi:MMPL family transporter [Streptomyces sp. NPDC003006]